MNFCEAETAIIFLCYPSLGQSLVVFWLCGVVGRKPPHLPKPQHTESLSQARVTSENNATLDQCSRLNKPLRTTDVLI